jgi:hypothetical protein
MISNKELLEERKFLNEVLKGTTDYNTQRDIFIRLADNNKKLKAFK